MNWCKKNNIEIKYTQPEKPMQNGYIERFNCFFREGILNPYYFNDIYPLQKHNNKWKEDYNHNHPINPWGINRPWNLCLELLKNLKVSYKKGKATSPVADDILKLNVNIGNVNLNT